MNAKKLHKHALPVISLAIAGLIISTVTAATLAIASQPNQNVLVSGLTTRAVSIQGSSNGLATLKFNQRPTNNDTLSNSDDLGSSALWYIALHPTR